MLPGEEKVCTEFKICIQTTGLILISCIDLVQRYCYKKWIYRCKSARKNLSAQIFGKENTNMAPYFTRILCRNAGRS